MRRIGLFSFVSLVLLAVWGLVSGCNRGAHPALTGRPAPDFTLSDGVTSVHLADYRGRVVLLNFWATWCGPCVEEIPSLLALHRDRPDLVILAVNVDGEPDVYRRFIARRHMNLTTVSDPDRRIARIYHTHMWPETYVIDRQGVIRRQFTGAQDWNSSDIRVYLKSL